MLADGVRHLDGVGLPRSVRNIAHKLLQISHWNSALNGTYKDGVSRGLSSFSGASTRDAGSALTGD